MTSVQDVFDQLVAANQHLVDLHNDTVAEVAATTNVKAAVDTVNASVQQVDQNVVTGFTVISQDMAVLAKIAAQEVLVLDHISGQQDTALCYLEKIARTTCSLLNEAHEQTLLQRTSSAALTQLLEMYKTDHADAALNLARHQESQAELERCCPPAVEPPPCQFEPCAPPDPIHLPKPDPATPQFPPPGDKPRTSKN
jgi:ABC-type transporter Mla subunit MlaD